MRKPVFGGLLANNKGADQPAHMCRLISTFVIRSPKSIIAKLASIDFSIFQLVSEAEENCLSLALMETPKTGFLAWRPILYHDLWMKVFRIIPEFSILRLTFLKKVSLKILNSKQIIIINSFCFIFSLPKFSAITLILTAFKNATLTSCYNLQKTVECKLSLLR